MEIGKKIVKYRRKNKLSQEQLAEKIGVTRQTISNWELNTTKPDVTQIKNIAKVLNTSIDDLLDNNGDGVKNKINNIENELKKNNRNLKLLILPVYFIVLFLAIGIIIYYSTKKDFTHDFDHVIVCTIEDYNSGKKYGLEPGDYYLYIDNQNETYQVIIEITQKDFEYQEDYDYVQYGKQYWDKIDTKSSNFMFAIDMRDSIKEKFIKDGAKCRGYIHS